MGFDLYGKNTTAEEGQYWRSNVWYWHPLANYLLETAPEIVGKIEYLHSNDGDGLEAKDSVTLADILDKEINEGRTQKYIEEREAELAALPDVECDICHGTGVRNDKYVQGKCNGCDGTGKRRPWETNYHMDLDLVKEFAVFVRHSGGFAIC